MKVYAYTSYLREDRSLYMERRDTGATVDNRRSFTTPEEIYDLAVALRMPERAEELIYAVLLDGRFHVIGVFEVAHGTTEMCIAGKREIVRAALATGAVQLVLVHNHPSGDPTPSREDIATTREVMEAGKMVQIAVQDHIVVGRDGFASIRELNPNLFKGGDDEHKN